MPMKKLRKTSPIAGGKSFKEATGGVAKRMTKTMKKGMAKPKVQTKNVRSAKGY